MTAPCQAAAPSATARTPTPRAHDPGERLAARCRKLLDEARSLGLDLDDIIDALRRSSAPLDQSH